VLANLRGALAHDRVDHLQRLEADDAVHFIAAECLLDSLVETGATIATPHENHQIKAGVKQKKRARKSARA
jgi:hypothetical protein